MNHILIGWIISTLNFLQVSLLLPSKMKQLWSGCLIYHVTILRLLLPWQKYCKNWHTYLNYSLASAKANIHHIFKAYLSVACLKPLIHLLMMQCAFLASSFSSAFPAHQTQRRKQVWFVENLVVRLRNAVHAAQNERKTVLPALKMVKGAINNGVGKLQRCSGKNLMVSFVGEGRLKPSQGGCATEHYWQMMKGGENLLMELS